MRPGSSLTPSALAAKDLVPARGTARAKCGAAFKTGQPAGLCRMPARSIKPENAATCAVMATTC